MPRETYKSERHHALDEYSAPEGGYYIRDEDGEWEPVPDSEVIWLLMPFIVACIGMAGMLLVVFS